MGFMTRDEAGKGKNFTLFSARNYVVNYVCLRPCIVMLENARSVILQEMTKLSFVHEPRKDEQ